MTGLVKRLVAAAISLIAATAPLRAADDVTVEEKTYAISGATGAELYASIGARGPKGAIAHTSFSLRWSRKYDQKGGSCRLVSMRPLLSIVYTLPKPSGRLPASVQSRWTIFSDGVRGHEQEHGRMIRDFVDGAGAALVGSTSADDPKCDELKQSVSSHLKQALLAHRERSRGFDRVELVAGGAVHRLILALVNEP